MNMDLNISLTDRSAKEFADELLAELIAYHDGFNTHAMTDRTNYLQGQKQMLEDVIEYIKKAKP